MLAATIGLAVVGCVLLPMRNGRASNAPEGGGKGAILSNYFVELEAWLVQDL